MGKTVLVVDDHEDVRNTCRFALETHGFVVEEAENGREALERLKERVPTVVLLDIMMPDVSGLDVLKVIRNDPLTAKLPVVMLTAKAADQDVLTGYLHDADYYLTKPYNSDELRYAIDLVLGRREVSPDEQE
jgi:DNA-binding response OmpR family regulator